MKLSPVTVGAVLALLLATAPRARAEMISWTYSWAPTPTKVNADAPGTGYVTFTAEGTHLALGNSIIVATNLQTFSTATTSAPDQFTAKNYTLSLTLSDIAGSASGAFSITGVLNGTLTAQSALISNTFTSPTPITMLIGDHEYTISMPTYTPPSIPSATNLGSISVVVTASEPRPISFTTPEPSALFLSCLAVATLGIGRLRRRRR